MAKQPKYFFSSKPLRPTPPSNPPTPALPEEVSIPTYSSTPVSVPVRLPKFTRILFLTAGLATLSGLTILVAFSTGMLKTHKLPVLFPQAIQGSVSVTGAHGDIGQGLAFDIQTADARVEIVRAFLERYKSPLTPHEHYATELVRAADRYGLDYRLLPAIMMQESNLCKTSDPKLKNCLGFGIHARGALGFDTYEAGFDRAARELKENYIDQGLTTPAQIMKKYTPSSNGSWEASVNQWISEMEHNDREIGKTASADADLLEYTAKK